MALFSFYEDLWPTFCTSISVPYCRFGTKARTHTHSHTLSCSQHHKGFVCRGMKHPALLVFSLTAHGAPKRFHWCQGECSRPPFQPVASATQLKVNHRGLGQILSSLENSLHMTHFRYPQILRTGRNTNTLKTHSETLIITVAKRARHTATLENTNTNQQQIKKTLSSVWSHTEQKLTTQWKCFQDRPAWVSKLLMNKAPCWLRCFN